jgi:hypothetical protein
VEKKENPDGAEQKALERKELDLLVGRGFRFHVTAGGRKKTFEIREPTAWVLDCLSALWLEMEPDDRLLSGEDTFLTASKQAVRKNARRMARVFAVATAGDPYSFFPFSRWVRRLLHRARVKRLTRLFYHTLRPSMMKELSVYLLATGNLADFINSMRLLSGARTTLPIKSRIEKQG